ncbi:SUZ domain-containing protein 1 isoform X2 [Echinops telfairi]|uniref:SUZ domain-containing protein 1 isoform X2 n=1 Tax=Echinops telfairi TaxID=9371 RepID=A0AC55DTJ2_ECHTE|nr:SUZ domain-containing protein 1 isoform X2 [Echinops telfairi]
MLTLFPWFGPEEAVIGNDFIGSSKYELGFRSASIVEHFSCGGQRASEELSRECSVSGRFVYCLPPTREIDRRLEKKLKITQKERKSKSPPRVPIVIQDDSLPTGPPPQIRILKRPTSNGVVSSPNSTSRPALPVKSLAQREAEYAEARKRILGSASPEEEQEKPILDRPTRISQPDDSRQPNNVIRQPLGPDGSQGFKQRR